MDGHRDRPHRPHRHRVQQSSRVGYNCSGRWPQYRELDLRKDYADEPQPQYEARGDRVEVQVRVRWLDRDGQVQVGCSEVRRVPVVEEK